MLRIANTFATAEAGRILQQMRASVPLQPGDLFALVYMSRFAKADGMAAPGFVPGYVAYPDPLRNPSEAWALVHLPDGFEFCFIPKFRLVANQRCAVDVASKSYATLSIGPQGS
jgi:hypothetical protein